MRFLWWSCGVALLFLTSAFLGAQTKTDAQNDGFAGPIRSVASLAEKYGVKWQQPGGPTMVAPMWCQDCEYDPDGTKTKSGQIVEGKFFGQTIRLIRDANGNVTDRYSYDAMWQRHDVMGPYGKTEQEVYLKGKLFSRSTFSYDQYGHMREGLDFDAAGKSDGRTVRVTDKDGTLLRHSTYDQNNELTWEQTYDLETDVEHFTTFDEFGKVKLTWTFAKGKLISFWELPETITQFGDGFIQTKSNND